MNKKSNFTKDKEGFLFIRFALPNILSLVLISSAGITDAFFIGMFAGEISLAAVNIVIPLFSACWGISVMITVGGAVRAGKYIGENNIACANEIFTKSMIAVAVISVIVSVLFIVSGETLARLIGASDKTAPLSYLYIKVIAPFIVFTTVGYGLSVFARVDGFPAFSSAALIAGALSNMALDALFIAVLDKGIFGAAIATGLSFLVTFAILAVHFALKRGQLRLTLKIKNWAEVAGAGWNGFSEFVNEISAGFQIAIFNIIMMKYAAESGVAAFTAVNYCIQIGYIISYGAADSLNPLISVNYGAGLYGRISRFIKIGLSAVTLNGLFVFFIMAMFPDVLAGIFIKDHFSQGFIIAVEFIGYVKWAFLVMGVKMIFSGFFTALQRPRESAAVAVLPFILTPVLLYILPDIFGKTGIYVALPISETAAAIVAVSLYFLYKKAFLKRKTFRRLGVK